MENSMTDNKSHATTDPLVKYASEHSVRLTDAQKQLIQVSLKHSECFNLGSADELHLLANICRTIKAKKTLDIGVYTGYSAMTIAMSLPDDGKVIACDITDEYPSIGKPFWKQAQVDHKIDLRIAPAQDTLQSLIDNGESNTFDFAFIDADKENYDSYYELCLKLVRPGGIIALDNMTWYSQVLDPSINDPETTSIRNLNDKLSRDERVDVSLLLIGDGTSLVFKK